MKVIIYGTETCPWCKIASKYLSEKKVEFNYIDVSKDELAYNLMVEKSGQRGVPVININGTYVVGFNREKIDNLLL